MPNFESSMEGIQSRGAESHEAARKIIEQLANEPRERQSEKGEATKDAESLLRSNPPDQVALDTLAKHLFAAFLEKGDNWSGQVDYAGKVNEELKKAGSKMRVVINTATRAFKNEVDAGEVGFFSIVDTDGNVIVTRAKY